MPLGEIEKIDPQRKAVTIAGDDLIADYVIVSLGAELAPETIPGLLEAGHNFYTLPGAESLRAALGGLERGRAVVMTAAPAYKCSAAPYQAALLIDAHLRRRGLRAAVSVEVYAAEPGQQPLLPLRQRPRRSAALRIRRHAVWSLALIHRPSPTLCRDAPGAISQAVGSP